MASGDLSKLPPKFLEHASEQSVRHNVGIMDNRGMPLPMQQQEMYQRQWVADERDAFISWLRSEFAAANAMIDAMCHHLRIIGEPGEYDFVLTCIQQRRYNWTAVLHMQQFFSVAEVLYALQQVAWRKHHARNSDLSRTQHAHPSVQAQDESSDVPKIPSNSNDRRVKQESSYSKLTDTEEASTSRDAPQKLRSDEARPGCSENQDVTGSEDSKLSSCIADIQSSNEEQTPASSISASDTTEDLKNPKFPLPACQISSEAAEEPDGKAVKQEARTEFENECGSSSTKNEGLSSESFSNMDFNLSSKEEENARLARIKVSKTYYCCERIEGKLINVVEGLQLYENVFNDLETIELMSFIHELQAAGRRGELTGKTFITHKKSVKGRVKESIQFGHIFHEYFEDGEKSFMTSKDEIVEPIPGVLKHVINRLMRWQILPANARPDCCIINILDEGDHAPPHMKHRDLERPFCTLSLTADCTMVFGRFISVDRRGECKGPFKVSLPAGSVLILQGNSANVVRQAIPASTGTRMIITFAKFLPTRASIPTQQLDTAHSTTQNAITPSTWASSVGLPQGGIGSVPSASASRGLAPMVLKNYNMMTASGVLPVPPVQSSPQMSHPLPPHISTTGIRPPFTSSIGPVGSYPPVAVIAQGWSAVPRPARPPSTGTGVFFPSGGSTNGPGRPISMPHLRPGVIMLSSLSQKADFLEASPSVPEASGSTHSSSKPSRHIAPNQFSVDESDCLTERATSLSSSHISPGCNDPVASRKSLGKEPINFGPKSEANGIRNTKYEQQNRASSHSKAAGGIKAHSAAVGSGTNK